MKHLFCLSYIRYSFIKALSLVSVLVDIRPIYNNTAFSVKHKKQENDLFLKIKSLLNKDDMCYTRAHTHARNILIENCFPQIALDRKEAFPENNGKITVDFNC